MSAVKSLIFLVLICFIIVLPACNNDDYTATELINAGNN
ncbi:hypothetical protein BA6E_1129 [Bacteroidales bacterium 6E]|nr:hypothetical protein BA6E_1129 [Bacteroidales bacterium 6E]